MSVRVRMAPSPTGFLHIGGVRTFLFNWLFARRHGGEILLRIENTDTSREVAEAVDQIKESLIWLGIDWDGDVTFQLDTADKARELAQQLLSEGKAYEDDGAIRFRQPAEGTVSWEDAVRGAIEFKNELLNDLVIVRSDGRPTYNFVSPIDDMQRRDHARDSRRGPRLEHADADQHPACARRRPAGLRARAEHQRGRRPQALEAPERRRASATSARRAICRLRSSTSLRCSAGATTTRRRSCRATSSSSVSRSSGSSPSPATFDYKKLDWMNGAVPARAAAGRVRALPLQVADGAGHRLAAGHRACDRAARAGEDREVLAVPRLRALPVRGRVARRRRSEDVRCRTRASAKRSSRGKRRCSKRRCARSPMSSARSRATHSRRSGSRSPVQRCRPACSRASSCSAASRSLARLRAASAGAAV